MIIPFESLYDYCNQIVYEDTVIYVFEEHGNKKIENIRCITGRNPKNWQDSLDQMCMLMHDQEPLQFELYQSLEDSEIRDWIKKDFNRRFEPTDQWINEFIKYTKNLNLNFFIDGINLCDKAILCHSEINSEDLTKYENIGFFGCYWWTHAAISLDWFRFARYDKKLSFDNQWSYLFNIYNRSWSGTREYRLKFTDLIIDKKLVEHCQIFFNPVDNGIHYRDYSLKNSCFAHYQDLDQLPSTNVSSTASATYVAEDYKQCSIDVVLETIFDDSRIQLTEKILRPIACGKPFILVGTPYSLKILKSYGFKTFGNLIDERYDEILDPLQRLQAITDLMVRISQMDESKRKDLLSSMHRVAEFNKQIFWSDDFSTKIWKEFLENYNQAHDHCMTHFGGKRWLEQRKYLAQKVAGYRNIINGTTGIFPRSELISVLNRVRGR